MNGCRNLENVGQVEELLLMTDRSIADKIKANRGTIDQRGRQQEKSRRRSRGMEI